MQRSTRSFAIVAAVAVAAFQAAGPAVAADAYPSRAVRIVVPYATGGGSDVLARQIGAVLQQKWGQPVVVENKAGASGSTGTLEVVRAPADGHTLLLQNSTMVTSLAVNGRLPYDPEKDLTPIMLLGVTPIAVAAHPSAGIGSLKELVAAAKAKPGSLSYGSCGIGTPQHFAMEFLLQKAGIEIVHSGYKGCSPAVVDVLGGHIALASVSSNLVAPYAKDGRLRIVGVTTARRSAQMPDVPTFEEQGFRPFDFSIWYALMAPAKLPSEVAAKIAADVGRILADPAVRSQLAGAGVEPLDGSAQELARLIRSDAARYQQLARSAGIKPE